MGTLIQKFEGPTQGSVSKCLWDLAYPDLQEFLAKSDVILIPLASVEHHGPHLPLGTDSFQCLEITRRAAEIADVPYTPVLPFGYSPHHLREPELGIGTITLRASTWQNVVYDIARSLIHHGWNKLVFVNDHSSNMKVIDPVMRQIRYDTGAFVAVYRPYAERYLGMVEPYLESPKEWTPGWHSAELETQQVMAYNERLVRMDRATRAKATRPDWLPEEFGKYDAGWDATFKGYEYFYFPMEHQEISPTGTIGDPFPATREKGEKTLQVYAEYLAEAVELFKKIKVQIKKREFVERAW